MPLDTLSFIIYFTSSFTLQGDTTVLSTVLVSLYTYAATRPVAVSRAPAALVGAGVRAVRTEGPHGAYTLKRILQAYTQSLTQMMLSAGTPGKEERTMG